MRPIFLAHDTAAPAFRTPVVLPWGRVDWVWMTLIIVAVCAMLGPFASLGIDSHHDGIMLKPAMDVASGQILFRDTFSQYGPLTTYLQAAVVWLDPRLVAIKWMAVMMNALAAGILFTAWRMVLPRSLAFLGVLLFCVCSPLGDAVYVIIPWSSEVALVFQGLALLALLRILMGAEAFLWGWMLGFACAATFWSRQPVGVLLTFAAGVSLAMSYLAGWRLPKRRMREVWFRFCVSFCLCVGGMLTWIASQGSWDAWVYQNLVWPMSWASQGGSRSLWSYFTVFTCPIGTIALAGLALLLLAPVLLQRKVSWMRGWWCLVYYGCIGASWWVVPSSVQEWLRLPERGLSQLIALVVLIQCFLFIVTSFRAAKTGRNQDFYMAGALTAVALASVAQLYPVACARHTSWALAPGYGLFVYSAWRWSGVQAVPLTIGVMIFLVPAAVEKIFWARYALNQELITLQAPEALQGMRVSPDDAMCFDQVNTALEQWKKVEPNSTYVMMGADALYLCFADNLTNPSPYFVAWKDLGSVGERAERIDAIRRTRPVVFFQKAKAEGREKFQRDLDYVVWSEIPNRNLVIVVPREKAMAGAAGGG